MERKQLLLAILLGLSGHIFAQEKNVVFCTPISWSYAGSGTAQPNLDKALACYYDFGYQTSDQQYCWVRFDTSSPDIQIGASATNFVAAGFLPSYYAGNCTAAHQATDKIWFSENSPVAASLAQLKAPSSLTAAQVAELVGATNANITITNPGCSAQCILQGFGGIGASRAPCSTARSGSALSQLMGFTTQIKTNSAGTGTCNTASSPVNNSCNAICGTPQQ